MKTSYLLIACTALYSSATAYNHPELQWQSVSTRHFTINYYDKTEPAVYPVSKIAEEVFEAIAPLMGYRSMEKINISLADYDDYSNGWASWTDRNIMIWVPDIRFDLRGNSVWLRNVITHELTHIISLEKRGSMQLLNWNFSFTYASPRYSATVQEPFASTMFYPAWFVEGVTQTQTERLGGDCWDSRRDMVLRCAARDKTMLTLDEMAHFNHDGLRSEMVYNQGFSLTNYIRGHVSETAYMDLWKAGRSIQAFPPGFETQLRNSTGNTLQWWHGRWLDSLARACQHMLPAAPTATKALWTGGYYSALPRVCPAQRCWGWLTNHKDDFQRTDLVIAQYGSSGIVRRIPYAQGSWDFSSDGKKVYYISSHDPVSRGSFFNNLYVADIESGAKKRLTREGRVYDLAAAPDGRSILCTRYYRGAFSLERFSFTTGQFSTVIEGTLNQPFMAVTFNPSDSSHKAAVARIINGTSEIFIVDLKSRSLTQLPLGAGQKESPHWGADGRIYFSADYDGIFNIYSVQPDGTGLTRHCSVAGGAFSPWRCADSSILCSEYSSSGFKIVSFETAQPSEYAAPQQQACAFSPLPVSPAKVIIKNRKYQPRLLRPTWAANISLVLLDSVGLDGTALSSDDSGSAPTGILTAFGGGAAVFYHDALDKKLLSLSLSGIAAPSKEISDNGLSALRNAGSRFGCDRQRRAAYDCGTVRQSSVVAAGLDRLKENLTLQLTDHWVRDALRDRVHSQFAVAASADSDSVSISPVIMLFIPAFDYQRRWETPVLGLSFNSLIVYVIPVTTTISPYAQWQLGRDMILSFNPTFQILLSQTALQAPVSISWSRVGYYTKDIQYTLRNVTEALAGVGVGNMPAYIFTPQGDSSAGRAQVLFAAGAFRYGAPLARYSSLVLHTELSGEHYDGLQRDPQERFTNVLSDFYFSSATSLSLNFPIIRTINRGFYYADALYGSLRYRLSSYSSRPPYASEFARALYRKEYDSTFTSVSHEIGIGFSMGLTKSYTFTRMLELTAAWDIWDRKYSLRASLQ